MIAIVLGIDEFSSIREGVAKIHCNSVVQLLLRILTWRQSIEMIHSDYTISSNTMARFSNLRIDDFFKFHSQKKSSYTFLKSCHPFKWPKIRHSSKILITGPWRPTQIVTLKIFRLFCHKMTGGRSEFRWQFKFLFDESHAEEKRVKNGNYFESIWKKKRQF